MVFVGRPFNYAMAVAGEAGVVHAIRLLMEEVDRNMAMLGGTGMSQTSPRSAGPQALRGLRTSRCSGTNTLTSHNEHVPISDRTVRSCSDRLTALHRSRTVGVAETSATAGECFRLPSKRAGHRSPGRFVRT